MLCTSFFWNNHTCQGWRYTNKKKRYLQTGTLSVNRDQVYEWQCLSIAIVTPSPVTCIYSKNMSWCSNNTHISGWSPLNSLSSHASVSWELSSSLSTTTLIPLSVFFYLLAAALGPSVYTISKALESFSYILSFY